MYAYYDSRNLRSSIEEMNLLRITKRVGTQIQICLLRRCLAKTLVRSCPNTIPRSGERAKEVNCYVAALDKGAQPHLLVRRVGRRHIGGLEWDSSAKRYSRRIRYHVRRALSLRLRLIHYVGTAEVEYEGILSFWIGNLSRVPYVTLFVRGSADRLSRVLFNRRSQLEASRERLLEYVVDEFAVSRLPFDSGGILTKMYRYKWYSHPAAKSARVRTEYLLQSLEETGDLKTVAAGQYVVAPRAFKTLSEIREARRRHRQSMGFQYAIIFLTLGTLLAALIQAGIVRSPPLLIAECKLEQGVASDCTFRWHLWPNNTLSSLIKRVHDAFSKK